MAKTKISSTDLIWIFREKLSSFDDCSPSTSIAIVPSSEGWTAVTTHRDRTGQPNCVRRIQQLQKQLREIYVLAKAMGFSHRRTPRGKFSATVSSVVLTPGGKM